jgi:hypothetical protein
MDGIAQYGGSAKILDVRELTSPERLRSIFPYYSGNQFLVVPVDRSIDFSTGDVTRLNSLMALKRHGDDEW